MSGAIHRVAFAGLGDEVDSHFGQASRFQVYDLSASGWSKVATRRVSASCAGDCEGSLGEVLGILSDCAAVFALKIGTPAALRLASAGIRTFEAEGGIEEILAELSRDGVLNGGDDSGEDI